MTGTGNSDNIAAPLSKAGKRRADPLRARPLADSVLQLIWREHQISRAEIARRFGLSRSTVTEIMKELLKSGFVDEVGSGESRGGRRPILLQFVDSARVILGVDIGATHVSVALTDMRGKLLEWREMSYPVRSNPAGTMEQVIQLSNACLAERGLDYRQLLNIGVAVPSPVDPLHPEWLSEVVIPAWQGRNELERLRKHFGVPVYVDNDANLGALAEHWWGAGRDVDDLVYIKIAFGIGAGYILQGEIYRGSRGVAGEMGHIPIDPNGRQCVCGLRGCLATFVGAPALELRAQELLADYPDSILSGREPEITAIENAALAGDELALKMLAEAAEYIGIAIAGFCNLMNPKMVVLGGSLARLGELLFEPLRRNVSRCTLVGSIPVAEILPSEHGARAVAIGAAALALDAAFDELHFLERNDLPEDV